MDYKLLPIILQYNFYSTLCVEYRRSIDQSIKSINLRMTVIPEMYGKCMGIADIEIKSSV